MDFRPASRACPGRKEVVAGAGGGVMATQWDPAAGTSVEAIRALAEGRHPDPFGLLGCHTLDGKRIVRAFVPGARGIDIAAREDGRLLGSLVPGHAEGFFAGPVGEAG